MEALLIDGLIRPYAKVIIAKGGHGLYGPVLQQLVASEASNKEHALPHCHRDAECGESEGDPERGRRLVAQVAEGTANDH
jgi:hypothetical protein